jgi:MFS family permease
MYVDRAASKDIKATAQSFLMFVVYGLGTVLGSVLTGWVRKLNTSVVNGIRVEDWRGIWLGPFVLTVLCIVAFALLFREREIGAKVEEAEAVMS